MVNGTKIKEKDYVNTIINNINDSSNKELLSCLEILNKDFEETKTSVINLTQHLDTVELLYNKVFKEYKKRNNVP